MADATHEAQVIDTITRFFKALEDGDYATCADIFTPDGLVWHNYDQVEQPVAETLAQIKGSREHIERVTFDIVRRYVVPDGCIQQHVVHGVLKDGGTFDIHVVQRLCVEGGRINRIEEYFDSRQSPAAH